ncbi:hypothetical protein [Terrarubrum flagellatum]|uniref:hypothetical protein n=1 Tax=Terrirubrum flagellatum TaxID=2895980 RepID=UPI003145641F
MIILRLARGIHKHFPARRSEWALGAMLFSLGAILLHPDNLFDSTPLYHGLKLIASEKVWGWGCFLVGFVRLIALILNGTFADTAYSRWSPHVRGAMAFLSCFFWAGITIGIFYAADHPVFGMGIFPFLLALELTNIHQALTDAGAADRDFFDAPGT